MSTPNWRLKQRPWRPATSVKMCAPGSSGTRTPKFWAKAARIEKEFADDADAAGAAHIAAGTWNVMFKMAAASLEAKGKIERSGTLYRIRSLAS